MPQVTTPSPAPRASQRVAVAALSVELARDGGPPETVRLLPAGRFRPQDGRAGVPDAGWYLSDDMGRRIATAAAARQTETVIDYHHQTLYAAQGVRAPAAGWCGGLEYRPGDGLYAVDVRWTDAAATAICAGEYRYLSPVFPYSPRTGEVLGLAHASLTNTPAIDGLVDLAACSVDFLETSMNDELIEQLRWMLNMPLGATVEQIVVQLQAIIDQIKAGPAAATAAAGFDFRAYLQRCAGAEAALAALQANPPAPDPAAYAPVAALTALQTQLAAAQSELSTLRAAGAAARVDEVVTAALSDGRLLPALEGWARDLGRADPARLDTFLAACTRQVPGMQTGGKPPGGQPAGGAAGLDETALAVCSAMGLSPKDFAAAAAAEAAEAQ